MFEVPEKPVQAGLCLRTVAERADFAVFPGPEVPQLIAAEETVAARWRFGEGYVL